jgi:hypothetical protein
MSNSTDWEAVEREYRAGQLSVSEIGRQHGVSHTAINKRAKKEGWLRDLSKKVRQTVSARLVSAEVSATNAREAVELAAARGVEVVRQHRRDIARGRDLTLRLLDELDGTTAYVGEIEAMIVDETAGDRSTQRRNAMLKAVSLPSRAGVIKDLSAAAKNWITLERQAFNLDEGIGDDEPATKADVHAALSKLNQAQRDNLRGIAEALAGGSGKTDSGA